MAEEIYVPIQRRFSDVDQETTTGLARRIAGKTGKTWADLVPLEPPPDPRSAVVVIGPSGVGKTSELKAHAARLRLAGIETFWMRAVDVAVAGVSKAIAEPERLVSWMDTTARAVFFLDAVDEAGIEGHDLERVMQRFSQDVDPATKAIQLVVSSRADLWAADDARHVIRALALPKQAPVAIVRLEPFFPEDLRSYAKANGVVDTEAFMRAFHDEEVDGLFDLRPPDALVLVEYWKYHGAFGTWSEMLEAFIDASIRNENKLHAMQQQFTLEEARSGLARLGAAAILGKRSLISRRGTFRNEASAERLFPERRPASIAQLLAMGLFTPKGLHSVQLPLTASHFLAASWLAARAKAGMDQRVLEEALLFEPFGAGHVLTPESRSPVVGWVAGAVPALRKRLMKTLPHVLLFEGDPSKLSRGECIEALRNILAGIKSGRHDPSPTTGTLRQVAKHDIPDVVVRLLREFAGTPRAERLLLRIAEQGRYAAVAAQALELALGPSVTQSVGGVAVRVVAVAGTTDQKTQLLALTQHPDEGMRVALAQALTPDFLNGPALVQLVGLTKSQDMAFMLAHALTQASLADIDAILVALMPRLRPPFDDATEPYVELVAMLAATRLSRGGTDAPTWMPNLLLLIDHHVHGQFYIPKETLDVIEAKLAVHVELRRAVWDARMAEAPPQRGMGMMSPRIAIAHANDLEWFWEKYQTATDQSLREDISWPLNEALRRTPLTERRLYMDRADVLPVFKAFIDVAQAQADQVEAAREQQKAREAAERAAARSKNVAEVQPLRAQIEDGTHGNALVWGWRHLTGTDGSRSRLGTGRLVEAVGRDLADSFILGFQRWWRKHDPSPRQLGSNQVRFVDLAGLTGLSLEIERGLDLKALSDEEVDRAVRYALYELNGLPNWFDSLRVAHPLKVRSALQQIVHAEWAATVEHFGIIHRATFEPIGTAELVRELVIDELERGAPGHPRTVRDAVDSLLLPTKPVRDVGPLLAGYAKAATGGDISVLAEWLRGWSHFAPATAAAWLQKTGKSDRSRLIQLVEALAARLEQDFEGRGRSAFMADWSPSALEAWIRMLHVAVRPEDDVDRGTEVYSPEARDEAQDFRRRCVSLLARNPSREAFEALRRIRTSKEMRQYTDLVDARIMAQLAEAGEYLASAWTEDDILRVERGDERRPRSSPELFALVKRHLMQVADLLENDDFSYATLFDDDEDEREVQCWVASSLKLVSHGLYTVEREPEVQDNKLMDISISVPGVGRVPIEIKPLDASRYSFPQLKAFVSDQLLGRYMRPALVDSGILLLVQLKTRTWPGHAKSLDELRVKLQAHANVVAAKAYKQVQVMCIDVAGARPMKAAPKSKVRSAKVRQPKMQRHKARQAKQPSGGRRHK
jgi:hypothetical protein